MTEAGQTGETKASGWNFRSFFKRTPAPDASPSWVDVAETRLNTRKVMHNQLANELQVTLGLPETTPSSETLAFYSKLLPIIDSLTIPGKHDQAVVDLREAWENYLTVKIAEKITTAADLAEKAAWEAKNDPDSPTGVPQLVNAFVDNFVVKLQAQETKPAPVAPPVEPATVVAPEAVSAQPEEDLAKLPIWEQVAQLEAYRAGAKEIEDDWIFLTGIESLINKAKDKHKVDFDLDAQQIAAATDANVYVRKSLYDTTKSSGLIQELVEVKKRYETLMLVYSRRESLMHRLATADLNTDNVVFSQLATLMNPARVAVVQELSKPFETSDLDQVAASITTFLTAKIRQYKPTLEEAVVNQAVAVFVEEFITERKSAEKPKETAAAMTANTTLEEGAEAIPKKENLIKTKWKALLDKFNAQREESFDSLPSSQKVKRNEELQSQLESLDAQKKELSAGLSKAQDDRNQVGLQSAAATKMPKNTPQEIELREAALEEASNTLLELAIKMDDFSKKISDITDQEKIIKKDMERPLHERVLLSIAGAELGDTKKDVLKKWLSMDSLKREALPTTIAGAVGFGVSVGSGFFGVSPMVRSSIGFALMSGTAAGSAISYGKLSAAKEKAGDAGWLKTRDIYEKGADLMAWIFKNNHVVYAFSAGMIAGAQVQSFAGMASADAHGIAGLAHGADATPTPEAAHAPLVTPSPEHTPTPEAAPTPTATPQETPVPTHETNTPTSGSLPQKAMQSFYDMFGSLESRGVNTNAGEQNAFGPQPAPIGANESSADYFTGLDTQVAPENAQAPREVTFAVQNGENPLAFAERISEHLPAGVHFDTAQLATAITEANGDAIKSGNVWDVAANQHQDSDVLNVGSGDHRSDAVTINTTTGEVTIAKHWVEDTRVNMGQAHQDVVGHAKVDVTDVAPVATDTIAPPQQSTEQVPAAPVSHELQAGTTIEYAVHIGDNPEKIADGLIAQLPKDVAVDRAALITSITNTNEQAIQQFHIVDQVGQPVDSQVFNFHAEHPDTASLTVGKDGKPYLEVHKAWLEAVRQERGTWDNIPIVASTEIQLHAAETTSAQAPDVAPAQTAAPVAPVEAPAPVVEQPVATLDSVLLGIHTDHPGEVKDFLSFVTEQVMTVDEQHTPASNLGQLSPDHIDKFAQVVDNVVADVEIKNGLNIENINDNQMEAIGLSPARQEIVHILQKLPGDHAEEIAFAITQDGQIADLFNQDIVDVDGIIERLGAIIK